LIYDPQDHQILDIFIVEDYEKEHGAFISHLLEIFEKAGKPQAIHCFGKRTLPLLEKIGPQMGIMVVDGGKNEEIDSILMDMMHALFTEDEHEHHHHGDGCTCGHNHEEEN
jgi:ABC-type nickel/cobalt efflux system permease component RcnA